MSFSQQKDRHGLLASRPSKKLDLHDSPNGSSAMCTGFSHPYHPNCPDSLNCLADTDEKPNHILPVMVRSAILGSPMRKLTLRGIYAAIEGKWPYFRTAPPGWKDSIRHNLSLNRLFKKLPRPRTESGYGSYWTVDLYAPPGSKRPRKRRPPSETTSNSYQWRNYATTGDIGAMMIPPFRLAAAGSNPIAIRSSHSDSELEGDPEDLLSECETEGVASPVAETGRGSGVPPPVTYPRPDESDKERIARLGEQLFESQRQYSMASAFSLRLTEQLEEAKEDASRAQMKLRTAREQLEEELVARMEVDKKLEEEEILRKEAEEQLKNLLQAGGPGSKLFEAIKSIQDISEKALGSQGDVR